MNEFKIEKYSSENGIPQYFTQINVFKNFHVACKSNCTIELAAAVEEFEIASARIIDTIKGTSIEGQCLTGKKAVIIGNVKVSLRPREIKDVRTRSHPINKKIPFSTYIIIPANIDNRHFICLRYLIEDVTALIICKNKLFINIALFLQYEP